METRPRPWLHFVAKHCFIISAMKMATIAFLQIRQQKGLKSLQALPEKVLNARELLANQLFAAFASFANDVDTLFGFIHSHALKGEVFGLALILGNALNSVHSNIKTNRFCSIVPCNFVITRVRDKKYPEKVKSAA